MRKNFETVPQESRLTKDDLANIHKYCKTKLKESEVYVFSLVLCDNEIDRDFEKFSTSSLEALAKLFLGKSGVFDHDATSEKQHARIFSTKVETVAGKTNALNESYCWLIAKAYIPRLKKYEELIDDIETGVKKEVSVSCAVKRTFCSVCERKAGECTHTKGKKYDGKLCCVVLESPSDAYEWSFVAVPAQPAAGVLKQFIGNGEMGMEQVIQKIAGASEDVVLSKESAYSLAKHIEELEKTAEYGRDYKQKLTDETIRYAKIAMPSLKREHLLSLSEKMSAKELQAFHASFKEKAIDVLPETTQLPSLEIEKSETENELFQI